MRNVTEGRACWRKPLKEGPRREEMWHRNRSVRRCLSEGMGSMMVGRGCEGSAMGRLMARVR